MLRHPPARFNPQHREKRIDYVHPIRNPHRLPVPQAPAEAGPLRPPGDAAHRRGIRRAGGITVGRETFPYFIDPIASDYGRAFSLQKFDGEEYTINLGDNDGPPSCECKGHLRWHGKPNAAGRECKHLGAVRELVNRGLR
jgi:hypothetical protein